MSQFLRDAWYFIFRAGRHPVYRREMAGWSYIGFWRRLRRGCLPLAALVAVSTACCCGVVALSAMEFQDEWPFAILAMLIGLQAGGEIIRWLVGLLATALAATSVSAEVEADTLGLLRLTNMRPSHIALAKFGALIRQFRTPLAVVAAIRLIVIIGGLGWLVFVMVAEMPGSLSPGNPLAILAAGPLVVVSYVLAGAAVILLAVVGLAYYLTVPVLSTLVFAAVGLLASTWARTRTGGLMAAAGLRVALWAVSYVVGQVLALLFQLALLPVTLISSTPAWVTNLLAIEPGLLIFAVATFSIGWLVMLAAGQVAVALALVRLAARRIGRLPYG
jgi:hypothetical protein